MDAESASRREVRLLVEGVRGVRASFGIVIFALACQPGAAGRPTERASVHAARQNGEPRGDVGEPTRVSTPPAAPGPELPSPEQPVEIPLPRPALWVEVPTGIVAGLGRLRGPWRWEQCASVWFDEHTRVDWDEDGSVQEREAPIDTAFGRDGAYHDSPSALFAMCDVLPDATLRCWRDACSSTFEGRPLRCNRRPPPGRRSPVQRTRAFVPTRPWHGYMGPVGYACLRSEGRVRCYPIEDPWAPRLRRPAPVHAPEIEAWSDVRDLSGEGTRACAVLGDGSAHCWGMPYISTPRDDHEAEDEEAIHRLVLAYSGHPWVPRRIEGLPPVVQVSVGPWTTCARTDDGRVFCWGPPACLVPPAFPTPNDDDEEAR